MDNYWTVVFPIQKETFINKTLKHQEECDVAKPMGLIKNPSDNGWLLIGQEQVTKYKKPWSGEASKG
jgi:hypothetical protein